MRQTQKKKKEKKKKGIEWENGVCLVCSLVRERISGLREKSKNDE